MDCKKIIGTLNIILFAGILAAQSPYQLNWKKESIIISTGLASLGTGMLIHANTQTFTLEDIIGLDRSMVNRFDLKATYNLSLKARKSSDYLMLSTHLIPLIFLTKKESRSDFGKIALLYSETVLLTGGLTILTNRLSKRPQPYVFNEQANLKIKLTRKAKYAFFSGHTAISSANCFFFAKVYSDYFPDSKLKPFIWAAAATVPAMAGYLRIKAGNDYPTDVMTGYIVGGLVGYLIPHFHKVDKTNRLRLSSRKNRIVFTYKF